jgi:hypothetical protein
MCHAMLPLLLAAACAPLPRRCPLPPLLALCLHVCDPHSSAPHLQDEAARTRHCCSADLHRLLKLPLASTISSCVLMPARVPVQTIGTMMTLHATLSRFIASFSIEFHQASSLLPICHCCHLKFSSDWPPCRPSTPILPSLVRSSSPSSSQSSSTIWRNRLTPSPSRPVTGGASPRAVVRHHHPAVWIASTGPPHSVPP